VVFYIQVIFLSLLTFLIINFIGGLSSGFGYLSVSYLYKKDDAPAFNFIYKIFAPILLIFIYSILMYALKYDVLTNDIWMVVVGAWLIRITHTILWNRISLINWRALLLQAALSSWISYYLYSKFISKKSLFIPTIDNMANELWLIIVLYMYTLFNDYHSKSDDDAKGRKERYLVKRFSNLKGKYSELVEKLSLNKEIEILTYAIAIHENFNRPRIVRFFENIKGIVRPRGTYGIMQVKSDRPVTDLNSIEIGIRLLNDLYEKVSAITNQRKGQKEELKYREKYLESYILSCVTWNYNNSTEYSTEVMRLYREIELKYYTETKDKLDDPDKKFDALSGYYGY